MLSGRKVKRFLTGQSTLEYVIILSAIVLALLAARNTITNAVDRGVSDASSAMTTATGKLPGASAVTPTPPPVP